MSTTFGPAAADAEAGPLPAPAAPRGLWDRLTGGPRRFDVPCLVEVEQTGESLHAHAIPEGVHLRPGDRVVVHGAPTEVPFGGRVSVRCTATVHRAGPVGRAVARASALFELAELYHCGFEPKEEEGAR